MSLRLLDQLDRHAVDRPDATALAASGRAAWTWADLRRATVAFADRLSGLAAAGDVMILCSPNAPEFSAAFLAGLRVGLRVFPVTPSLAASELRAAIAQTATRVVVGIADTLAAAGAVVPHAISIADVTPDVASTGYGTAGVERHDRTAAAGLLLQSSGTTGLPKIVFRTGRSLDAVAEAMANAIGFGPTDRVLSCVPLCHSYGVEHGLLAPTWAGSAVRLCQGFDLPTVSAELAAGATIFPGVPFVYETLARQSAGQRFPALRRAYSAGGPLPAGVREACLAQLGVTVTQLYGATEIGSVTYSDPTIDGFDPASVGRAMGGVEVRVLPPDATTAGEPLPTGADGHVAVRATSMFDAYLDGSATTTPDGFFLTGDLGHLDVYGNLTLTGRLKLLIDVAGLKVNPLEVEAVLAAHPAVAACVVVPLPVTETVSRLKAIVVRRPGQEVTGEELRLFLRERVAQYKVPRAYEFRDDLPRSAAGKVLRREVTP